MSGHEQFADDLALHALGSLTGDERVALETHLQECAACRHELELLRGDTSLLAMTTVGPKPPAHARQRLMTAIASEQQRSAQAPRGAHFRARWGWLGWAAAVAIGFLCFGLMRQNSNLEKEIASLQAQYGIQQSELQETKETVAALLDPETQKVELVASGSKPQPRGKALYQRRTRNLIFLASSLPQLPPDKIYELWLFPANGGPPIAAGLFKPDAHGSATVVNPPLPEGIEARNFAVTLEPASGSHEAPRGTLVIVGVGE